MCLVFIFLWFSASGFAAEPKTVLEVKQATDNYFRNKNWTPFAASIQLSFFNHDNLKSRCSGTLLFDPLRKKLLMECFGQTGDPVFVFQNNDLHFLLYLPGMKRAWQGNIFELEYSDEFASHLKPLDLYRAVSPEAFSEDQAVGANDVSDGLELEIAKPYGNRRYLARRLILDKHGQVESETFLTPDGAETTVVTRENLTKIKNKLDRVNSKFYYAPRTSVSHPQNGDTTLLEIKKITLHKRFPEDALKAWLPEGVAVERLTTDD